MCVYVCVLEVKAGIIYLFLISRKLAFQWISLFSLFLDERPIAELERERELAHNFPRL